MLQKIISRFGLAKLDVAHQSSRLLATAGTKPKTATQSIVKADEPKEEKSESKKWPKISSAEPRKRVWPKQYRDTLFGVHPVEICLAEKKRKVYKVFCSKMRDDERMNEDLQRIIAKANARNIPVKTVHPFMMNLMTNKSVHQGIAAQASPLKLPPWSEALESFGKTDQSGQLCLYLDRIQDPMNMGAILRTAVFLGVDGIFVPNTRSSRISPIVAKASAGASECAPLYSVDDPVKLLAFLQRLGWDILGSDQQCAPYNEHPVTDQNRLIVLGNESHGVNEDLVTFFSSTVAIPTGNPRITSLNVSVAAGVLLAHFAKNKMSRLG